MPLLPTIPDKVPFDEVAAVLADVAGRVTRGLRGRPVDGFL
jgi:hypothetical protein